MATTTTARTNIPRHLPWDPNDVPYPTEPLGDHLTTYRDQHGTHHHPDHTMVTCSPRNQHDGQHTAVDLTGPLQLCHMCLRTNRDNHDTWAVLQTLTHIASLQTNSQLATRQVPDTLDVHETLQTLMSITDQLTSVRTEVALLPDHMDPTLTRWCLQTLEQLAEHAANSSTNTAVDPQTWARMLTADLCDYGTPASRGHNTTGRHWLSIPDLIKQHHVRHLYGDARKLASDVSHTWLHHIKAGHDLTDADQHAWQALTTINDATYELSATQTGRVRQSCQTLHQQLTDILDTQTQRLLNDTTDTDLGPASDNATADTTLVRIDSWWHHFNGRGRSRNQQLQHITGRAIVGRNAHRAHGTNHTLWLRCNRLEALWLAHTHASTVVALAGNRPTPDPHVAAAADLLQIDDPNHQLTAAQQLN